MSSYGPRGGQRRKRTKFNKNQHKVLMEAFEKDPYPDITVREELAKQIQIPEPRIQVWFQNQRTRIPKKTQRRPSGEAGDPVPGFHQGGFSTPGYFSHHGLLPKSDSNVTLQNYTGPFSLELEGSGQAILPGNSGVLGVNVASPGLETPARALGKPSGDFHCSLSSGFSFAALGDLPPAPQQAFPQQEAGGTRTHLEHPRALMTHGDWALQGWEQHPPSGEQLVWGCWQPPPALKPGRVPQQLLSQHPRAWEQPPPPQPPSAQEHWLDPADPSLPCLHIKPAELPDGHQEQFPPLPPKSGPLWEVLRPPSTTASRAALAATTTANCRNDPSKCEVIGDSKSAVVPLYM